jgi:hypothetical protein
VGLHRRTEIWVLAEVAEENKALKNQSARLGGEGSTKMIRMGVRQDDGINRLRGDAGSR